MEALHLSTGLAVDVPSLLLDVHRGDVRSPERGQVQDRHQVLSLWAANVRRCPIKSLSVLQLMEGILAKRSEYLANLSSSTSMAAVSRNCDLNKSR